MEQTTFTDSDGVVWSVREDGGDDGRPLSADVSPGTSWLRFESELEVRRLWHYPDDWRGLSPLQLESLLDRASTVIARFRPAPHRDAHNPSRDEGRVPAGETRPANSSDVPPSGQGSRGDKR